MVNIVRDLLIMQKILQQMLLKLIEKRVIQKTSEATGDFNANKIADRITNVWKNLWQNNSEAVINVDDKEIPNELYISQEKVRKLLTMSD